MSPLFGSDGRDTLADERWGGRVPIPTRGQSYTVVLFIYMYFVTVTYLTYITNIINKPIARADPPSLDTKNLRRSFLQKLYFREHRYN